MNPLRIIGSGLRRLWSAISISDLKSPTAWLTDWAMGSPTTAGTYISPGSAMALSAYYACLRAISEDVAKLPLNVYKRLDPRGKEIQRDHPAQFVLHDEFNPTMSAMTGREMLLHWALGWGNGYAEIVRDGSDKVRQLWPIHPDRIKPVMVGDRLFYEIQLAVDDQNRTREATRLPARDVVHIRGLGGDTTGYSVATIARESLGLTMGAQEFGSAFFGNDTTLGVYMVPSQKLGPEEREDFRNQLQQAKGAPGEAFKFMVLPHGMDVHRHSIPPKDAQFLEVREFQTAEVARWFRMPPHKIQHLANATFSNIEQQAIEYVGDTLMPWLVRCEQEYNRKLISAGRRRQLFTKHVVQALLRGDYAGRTAGYLSLQRMGVLSQNDIREFEELNPIEGDDAEAANRYYQQSQMIPLKDSAEPKPEPPPMPPPGFGPEPPNGDGEEPEEDDEAEARIRPLALDAAQRCVRRESNALRGPLAKYADDAPGFTRWANGFYSDQRDYVRNAFAPLMHSFDADEAGFTVYLQDWHRASLGRAVESQRAGVLFFDSYEPEAAEKLADEVMVFLEVK